MAKGSIKTKSGQSELLRSTKTKNEGDFSINQPPDIEIENHEISELKSLTRELIETVASLKASNMRSATLGSSLSDVKADLRTATRAVVSGYVGTVGQLDGPVRSEGCCGCTSQQCCEFEIVVSKVRAAKPQIEPVDAGEIGPLINALEIQLFASVDGVGALIPSLASTFDLRVDGIPGGPGPWVTLERTIGTIRVPKNATVTKVVEVQVREHDEGLERPPGMKDEIGEAFGNIDLNCCMERVNPNGPIDVYLLHGGEGRGMVQVAYYARRKCC
jgi:hypothetical protein